MASSTARKLRLVTGILVASFLATSIAALSGLAEMHTLLQQVKDQEERVRLALSLAAAVRDQYAHQAHSIILGNTSHLPLYEKARQRVDVALDRFAANAVKPEELRRLDAMRQATSELDRVFKTTVVPALQHKDGTNLFQQHNRLLELTTDVQDNADALASEYEASISGSEAHARDVQRTLFIWTISFLVAAVLLAIAFSIYIGRVVTRPLAILEAGAARLAQGDLSTRIDIDRPDEFGRLAAQINRMTTALKEHQEKLVQSERLAGIGRLAAGVAHEINNPIGVILGYTRLLQRRAPEAQAGDLKVIEDEALRCRDIVEGLLDLARPMKVGAEPVNLRELTEDVAARLRESGQFTRTQIAVEGAASIEGNASGLRQVLMNLLKNAAEAAGPGGRVDVRLVSNPEVTRVVVRDSGPGLSAEALAHVFEPFFTTKDSGTGLGLAISRAVAQAHRGDLLARNAPGGGAELTLELPRRS